MSHAPLFPVLPAVAAGFRHLQQDWPFLAALSTFPILVSFGTLLFLDLTPFGTNLLWVSVFKIPADFVKGIFLALFVRFILFKDTPHSLIAKADGQRAVASSAIIFTAISFFFSGILSTLAMANQSLTSAPSPAVMLVSAVGLVFMLWIFRFQFLNIAAAAGFPMRPFLSFLGAGFSLPVRILALWILAALPSIFILGLVGEMLRSLGGFESMTDMRGPTAWLFYLINSVLATFTAAIQTAGGVHAIKHGMKGDHVDV